jgi:hypothetical protein
MEPTLVLQLTLAAFLQGLLYLLFGRHMASPGRLYGKMAYYMLLTWILASAFGWWSLVWILGHPALDVAAHAFWCRNNGIDWRTCEPREKYLRLRPWEMESHYAGAD